MILQLISNQCALDDVSIISRKPEVHPKLKKKKKKKKKKNFFRNVTHQILNFIPVS